MSRRLFPRLALAALVVAVAGVVVHVPAAASRPLDHPWTGSGTGTTTVVSDGTTPPAVFSYDAIGFDGSWNFSTVASTTGTVNLAWNYTGFHSFFDVTVGLDAYVTHGATTTTTPLVDAGPEDCCTPPSGGFNYSGTVSLPVQAGDTYGFAMRGSNFDEIMTLQGTLTVDDAPLPTTKRQCKKGGWRDFEVFKNQGDCVSFVATGGKNPPSGSPSAATKGHRGKPR
jgi:hypothetical protein